MVFESDEQQLTVRVSGKIEAELSAMPQRLMSLRLDQQAGGTTHQEPGAHSSAGERVGAQASRGLGSQVADCGGPPVAAARLVRGSAHSAGSGPGSSEARLLPERCTGGCPDPCWWWSGRIQLVLACSGMFRVIMWLIGPLSAGTLG
jgi:hypothetical protein